MKRLFSESVGLVQPRDVLQRGFIDERLASRLWTQIDLSFFHNMEGFVSNGGYTKLTWFHIFDDLLGKPFDEIDDYVPKNIRVLKSIYMRDDWALKYDIAQFFGNFATHAGSDAISSDLRQRGESFQYGANDILEDEKSAYRFVSGQISEITSAEEIESIENALVPTSKFSGAEEHLITALRLYSDRKNPDYRNSIKESISSIESAFFSINGEKSQSLPSAIKKSEKNGVNLHPALSKGISSIYGWTSDQGGIRHALTESSSAVGEAEARLMITLCSSLLGYLKQKF